MTAVLDATALRWRTQNGTWDSLALRIANQARSVNGDALFAFQTDEGEHYAVLVKLAQPPSPAALRASTSPIEGRGEDNAALSE